MLGKNISWTLKYKQIPASDHFQALFGWLPFSVHTYTEKFFRIIACHTCTYTAHLHEGNSKTWCRPTFTLIEVNHKLSVEDENKLSEEAKIRYQRMVEKLIYLTLMRPNIIYVVNKLMRWANLRTSQSVLTSMQMRGLYAIIKEI